MDQAKLRAYVDQIFKFYDFDLSGTLDKTQLSKFFTQIYRQLNENKVVSESQVQFAVKCVDQNFDGKADRQQIFQVLKRMLSKQHQSQNNYSQNLTQKSANINYSSQYPESYGTNEVMTSTANYSSNQYDSSNYNQNYYAQTVYNDKANEPAKYPVPPIDPSTYPPANALSSPPYPSTQLQPPLSLPVQSQSQIQPQTQTQVQPTVHQKIQNIKIEQSTFVPASYNYGNYKRNAQGSANYDQLTGQQAANSTVNAPIAGNWNKNYPQQIFNQVNQPFQQNQQQSNQISPASLSIQQRQQGNELISTNKDQSQWQAPQAGSVGLNQQSQWQQPQLNPSSQLQSLNSSNLKASPPIQYQNIQNYSTNPVNYQAQENQYNRKNYYQNQNQAQNQAESWQGYGYTSQSKYGNAGNIQQSTGHLSGYQQKSMPQQITNGSTKYNYGIENGQKSNEQWQQPQGQTTYNQTSQKGQYQVQGNYASNTNQFSQQPTQYTQPLQQNTQQPIQQSYATSNQTQWQTPQSGSVNMNQQSQWQQPQSPVPPIQSQQFFTQPSSPSQLYKNANTQSISLVPPIKPVQPVQTSQSWQQTQFQQQSLNQNLAYQQMQPIPSQPKPYYQSESQLQPQQTSFQTPASSGNTQNYFPNYTQYQNTNTKVLSNTEQSQPSNQQLTKTQPNKSNIPQTISGPTVTAFSGPVAVTSRLNTFNTANTNSINQSIRGKNIYTGVDSTNQNLSGNIQPIQTNQVQSQQATQGYSQVPANFSQYNQFTQYQYQPRPQPESQQAQPSPLRIPTPNANPQLSTAPSTPTIIRQFSQQSQQSQSSQPYQSSNPFSAVQPSSPQSPQIVQHQNQGQVQTAGVLRQGSFGSVSTGNLGQVQRQNGEFASQGIARQGSFGATSRPAVTFNRQPSLSFSQVGPNTITGRNLNNIDNYTTNFTQNTETAQPSLNSSIENRSNLSIGTSVNSPITGSVAGGYNSYTYTSTSSTANPISSNQTSAIPFLIQGAPYMPLSSSSQPMYTNRLASSNINSTPTATSNTNTNANQNGSTNTYVRNSYEYSNVNINNNASAKRSN